MTIDLTDPIFHDEAKAREWLESYRWPNGPYCCHCGETRVAPMGGKKHRPGLYYCPDCRGQFTVMTGSVMESSHVKVTKWVLAIRLMASSKKGFSAHQLHRSIGTTYKTAWFMTHRIRLAMATEAGLLGSGGGAVEADEAYIGRSPSARKDRYPGARKQNTIFALVERDGKVKSTHISHLKS